ncbi:MAG TPA: Asp-tRNA(Asn)/Glu-tRNA(Gln) amidotransferase subunit GatA [Chloroflexota bacterium]
MKPYELTIHEAHDLLKSRRLSSEELTRSVLDRIEAVDPLVHAFVTVTADLAMAQAREADQRRASGEDNPFLGVPVALKDLISTSGVRTTCSSRMLENYVPVYDAFVAERLRGLGAVLVGKTNMDEFAMGSSTENSGFFTTLNPWDLTRVPGGSSGGSAAAVAADEAPFALGSDTGGSIRQPASLCGIVGMKPTYGAVSRFGLIAFASSLDQIGPMTKDVTDCALVLNAIAGHDRRDSTSLDFQAPDYTRALVPDLKGLRVGIPVEYFAQGIDPEVDKLVRDAVQRMRELGAEVGEVSLPHTGYGLASYYIIAPAECSSNLARYDGVKYGYSAPDASSMWDGYLKTRERGFGPEVKRRIMIGTYALSSGYYDAYYLKAQKVRTLIKRDFDEAFEQFDLLAAPTSPTVAFRVGEKANDPLAMYASDICTIPVNLAGLPGVSLPCGFSQEMPVGLQLIGKPLGEETLLRAAYAYEQSTEWRKRKPELTGAATEDQGGAES